MKHCIRPGLDTAPPHLKQRFSDDAFAYRQRERRLFAEKRQRQRRTDRSALISRGGLGLGHAANGKGHEPA